MYTHLEILNKLIVSHCQEDLLYQSRVHPLSSFVLPDGKIWIKREDESGFGISGCKKRKYASLIPWLQKHSIQVVGLIGSSRSNHIVGMLQLLKEKGIQANLYLKENHSPSLGGNVLLRKILIDDADIHWVSSDHWAGVEEIAQKNLSKIDQPFFLIPEGGTCAPSLLGACSLMPDILRNEAQLKQPFDHIWIDAGTGLMAGALILSHAYLGHSSQLHIVSMTGGADWFQGQLMRFQQWWEDSFQIDCPTPNTYQFYRPPVSKAFGSINRRVLATCKQMAQAEGILIEPVYMAKLMMTIQQQIAEGNISGKHLIIHSGGGTALFGYDWS